MFVKNYEDSVVFGLCLENTLMLLFVFDGKSVESGEPGQARGCYVYLVPFGTSTSSTKSVKAVIMGD